MHAKVLLQTDRPSQLLLSVDPGCSRCVCLLAPCNVVYFYQWTIPHLFLSWGRASERARDIIEWTSVRCWMVCETTDRAHIPPRGGDNVFAWSILFSEVRVGFLKPSAKLFHLDRLPIYPCIVMCLAGIIILRTNKEVLQFSWTRDRVIFCHLRSVLTITEVVESCELHKESWVVFFFLFFLSWRPIWMFACLHLQNGQRDRFFSGDVRLAAVIPTRQRPRCNTQETYAAMSSFGTQVPFLSILRQFSPPLFTPFPLLLGASLSWGWQGSRLFNRRCNSLFSLVSFANAQSDKEYKSRAQLSGGDWAKAPTSISQAELE